MALDARLAPPRPAGDDPLTPRERKRLVGRILSGPKMAKRGPGPVVVDLRDVPGDVRDLAEKVAVNPSTGGDLAKPLRPGEIVPPPRRGYKLAQSQSKAKRGFYAPITKPAHTTTRKAEILNTALVAAATSAEGTVIGTDCLSNTLVAHDVFTAYNNHDLDSPTVIILGNVGSGKSSLAKTVYVMRALLNGRRVVIFDKKDRGGEGEYSELARALNCEPIKFVIGDPKITGGTTLNLLDPVILAGDGVAGQFALLAAVGELAGEGEQLDKWEAGVLELAHSRVLAACGMDESTAVPTFDTTPQLFMLVEELGRVHTYPQYEHASPQLRRHVEKKALGMQLVFGRLLGPRFRGLFDGLTHESVRLAEDLTCVDMSRLPSDGPAVSMVMAAMNTWLLGRLSNDRKPTNLVCEEGWHLVDGPGGRVFQRNIKLARPYGLSVVVCLHHLSDIPKGSPAYAIAQEAETAHIYRQKTRKDRRACIKTFGLDSGASSMMGKLKKGHHLLKIADKREIHIQHHRSSFERRMTNTDEGMSATPRGRR